MAQESGIPEIEEPEDPETLMDAIIVLDEQFKGGKLPEEAYRQRRAELKAKLQKAMK